MNQKNLFGDNNIINVIINVQWTRFLKLSLENNPKQVEVALNQSLIHYNTILLYSVRSLIMLYGVMVSKLD